MRSAFLLLAAIVVSSWMLLVLPSSKSSLEWQPEASVIYSIPPEEMMTGIVYSIPVTIMNTGNSTWTRPTPGNPRRFHLAYFWLDAGTGERVMEGIRTPLPAALLPGQSATAIARVATPGVEGRFLLRFAMVHELVRWLPTRSNESRHTLVPPETWSGNMTRSSWSLDDPVVTTALNIARGVVEACAVEVTVNGEKLHYLVAGAQYPEAWIRDNYWTMPAAQWFLGEDYQSAWILDALRRQYPDGAIPDNYTSNDSHRNTVISDQEALIVLAAHRYCTTSGSIEWLEASIDEIPAIDRLQSALGWLWRERVDGDTGLIYSGHTADWGDVESGQEGPESLYLDDSSMKVAGIYTQALACQAARSLAEIFTMMGRSDDTRRWMQRYQALRDATQSNLWMQDRGYYRVHKHLQNQAHDFTEDTIFAFFGNLMATRAGFADSSRLERIFSRFDTEGLEFARVLRPPYPAGVFLNTHMDEPGEYQNGGIWIWQAGQLVLDEFKRGYSTRAFKHLRQLAHLIRDNRDVYEWYDEAGKGRGSPTYAAAASSLLQAAIEGLYGIETTGHSVALSVRLGLINGRIAVWWPDSERNIAYRYAAENGQIRFQWSCSGCEVSQLRILVPAGKNVSDVRMNGEKIEMVFQSLENDLYLLLPPIRQGTIIVKLNDR